MLRTAVRTPLSLTGRLTSTAIRALSSSSSSISGKPLIKWFSEIGMDDVGLVGGKNASLGEMLQHLDPKGVSIPNGFAVTAAAYFHFLRSAGIEDDLRAIAAGLDINDVTQLRSVGHRLRGTILNAEFDAELDESIREAYSKMEEMYKESMVDVAIRSSATAEDLPNASFAGQQETFLGVRGDDGVVDATRRCMASLFTDRAISYRVLQGFDHWQVGLSVAVQKMVDASDGSSGVMFSLDTESGNKDVVMVNAAWGLGENVVQGAVSPDEFYVFKPTLMTGHRPVLSRKLGAKEMTMQYSGDAGRTVKNVATSSSQQNRFCVTDDDVLQLAKWAVTIEDHYSERKGSHCPMDMEWVKDKRGRLFIVQARPETVHSQADVATLETFHRDNTTEPQQVLARGQAVGARIGTGKVSVLHDAAQIEDFTPGDVLVTEYTDPNWEPILTQAGAVVTNRGGRTCHAAIISRELGIPCLVGCGDATERLTNGETVTVDCSVGEIGEVLKGTVPFSIDRVAVDNFPATNTKIMMNLANPEQARSLAALPCDGVGLARMEFIVANHIKAHPRACLDPSVLTTEEAAELEVLSRGYDSPREFFVSKLAQGVGTLAAAFAPKPVILRLSDFKTNEYRSLLGGHAFEPVEENPMLGWRGASRYYHADYKAGFQLEVEAVKRVREVMGLTNLSVMVPFCRTPDEGRRVIATMEEFGLSRKTDESLSVYVMCEIPSNVLQADAFLDVFDGFSIGSNDLTQMCLGVDRDSGLVAHLFDERDPAPTELIKAAIKACSRRGKYVGICGQAPSDYPEVVEMLVREGIESMSLNPDTILKTRLRVAEVEKELQQ